MDKIHIAICDDDGTFLKHLKNRINSFYLSKGEVITITEFTNGEDLINGCKELEFDLIFLDIEMPQMTGIEVITKLRAIYDDMTIILLTNYEDYVFESFRYNPFRYIRKSRIDNELEEALEAFQYKMKKANSYYSFTTSDGIVSWRIDDIQYMEVFQHYIHIHNKDKTIKVRASLEKLEKEFSYIEEPIGRV